MALYLLEKRLFSVGGNFGNNNNTTADWTYNVFTSQKTQKLLCLYVLSSLLFDFICISTCDYSLPCSRINSHVNKFHLMCSIFWFCYLGKLFSVSFFPVILFDVYKSGVRVHMRACITAYLLRNFMCFEATKKTWIFFGRGEVGRHWLYLFYIHQLQRWYTCCCLTYSKSPCM